MLSKALQAAAGNAGGPLDAQFNYVTMLLHGDGTNGAQNNTFLDSSTNNFTITRSGNTTQGSFSPYGDYWSTRFTSSTTSYMSVAGGSTLSLGTGDFTIEFWLNRAELGTMRLFGWANANDTSFGSEINASNKIWFGGWNTGTYSSASIPADSWTHIAMTRTGGVERLFINGTLDTSATRSTNYSSTASLDIGVWTNGTTPYNGYISNFRVVKGTALYTSSFTPSTTPLTAISGTQALVCQSNRFKDSSSNGFTITTSGTPSVQRFNPFGTADEYETATIGGSGYFDGTGDYLQIADSAEFLLGTSNYTMELWVYPTSFAAQSVPFTYQWSDSGGTRLIAWVQNTDGTYTIYYNNANSISTTNTVKLNAWNHIALVRDGNVFTFYINGVSTVNITSAVTYSDSPYPVMIGSSWNGSAATSPFPGYISDVRVVVGTAIYTSAFTPPTAPLTAVANTKLLCNMTNGAIYDNAMMNDLETVGNAQISTSVKKYGTGSLSFDGTGDYLQYPFTPLIPNGTESFTIECWINVTTNKNYNYIFSAGYPIQIYMTSAGYVGTAFNDTDNSTSYFGVMSSTTAITTGTWYHVAITRSGSNFYLFVNGALEATASSSASILLSTTYKPTVADALNTGTSAYCFNGYIDDFRITKGYARYTTTFTPPTEAFPNIGPT